MWMNQMKLAWKIKPADFTDDVMLWEHSGHTKTRANIKTETTEH